MSGFSVKKYWHIANYKYLFYRFIIEDLCFQLLNKSSLIILDIGCGPNVSSLSIVPDNVYFVGIDISLENISKSHQMVKKHGYQNISYVAASITSMPFRNESYELLLCCDVLEHIETKDKGIPEISRISRPEGIFIGSTTNLYNPIIFLDTFLPKKITNKLTKKFAGVQYERHSRFTIFQLLQLLSKAGFNKIRIELLGFPFFQPWIYEFSDKKPPWFAHLWIAFDKLTSKRQLRIFKETIVFLAQKKLRA